VTYRKKLIEVALPLDAINAASAREKSIRHGHPSTLHLWWARRRLAACRAVLFAQLVDDPSSLPDEFPTEQAQEQVRQRLFGIIQALVPWENSNNKTVVDAARREIARSVARAAGVPLPETTEDVRRVLAEYAPPVLDPFCGGGSMPLEAQRLGLEAHASDLTPVKAGNGRWAAYVAVQTAQVEELERTLPAPPQGPAVQLLSVDGAMVSLAQGEWAEVKTVVSALRALREEVAGPAPAGPPDTAPAGKRAAHIQFAVFAAQGYPRGKYAVFAAQGFPRGSGSVESANRLVVEARLKGTGMRAGMRWARPHVNPLVVLRTVACSDRPRSRPRRPAAARPWRHSPLGRARCA